MRPTSEIVAEAEAARVATLRAAIEEGLRDCTEEQQALFVRLYPHGPTVGQIPNALDQVRRTVEKNKEPK